MFSSKSCIVSGLTFRSLIHFGFIFVYGVRACSNSVLLHVAVQFSQPSLFFLMVTLAAYGNAQARGQIGAAAASLRHSQSNLGSKPCLQPIPQLMQH